MCRPSWLVLVLAAHKSSSVFSHHLRPIVKNHQYCWKSKQCVRMGFSLWFVWHILVLQLLQAASVGHLKQRLVHSLPQAHILITGVTLLKCAAQKSAVQKVN